MYLDADPLKTDQNGYGGWVLNDNFALNADVMCSYYSVTVNKSSSSKSAAIDLYHAYVEIYILEPWWQKLAIGDELFISYGVDY